MSDAIPEMDDIELRDFFDEHPPPFRKGTHVVFHVYDGTPAPFGEGGKQGKYILTARTQTQADVVCSALNELATRVVEASRAGGATGGGGRLT